MEAALKQEEQNLDSIIDRIVNEWQLPLLRLCFIQLRDRTMAEDAVQETFIKAFRTWGSYRGECSEKTWLVRIAMNTCKDMRRGGWFRHTNRNVSPEMLPETVAQPSEDRLELTLAVMNLPVKFREAIILYYYQDMDTVEIGKVLGITQPSVSNRLKRGRELLRKALEGRNIDE